MPSMSTELQSVRWQGGASGPGLGNTFVGRNQNPALGEWETTSFVVMGSAGTDFYNNAYSRQGWADVAAAVRERWQAGDRDGAASLVTDEMVLGTTLIGTEGMVRARLGVWRDAGVDTVRLYPAGDTLDARLTTLGRALELVREVG